MIETKDITSLLADTYYKAALEPGNDMTAVAAMLETIRPLLAGAPVYDVWKNLQPEEKHLGNKAILRSLVHLKYGYYDLVLDKITEQARHLATERPAELFPFVVSQHVLALANWEAEVYDRLCDASVDWDARTAAYLRRARTFHRKILDNRWADCLEWYQELQQYDFLEVQPRTLLTLITGLIYLFHYNDTARAQTLLEKARTDWPKNSRTERGIGEIHLKKGEFEAARRYYTAALIYDKDDCDNYLSLADSYRDEGKLMLAEEYYRDGLKRNVLETSPYSRLIELYADPVFFPDKKENIAELFELIQLLNPRDKKYGNWVYNTCVTIGNAFLRNGDYATACTWFEKALQEHPDLSNAYLHYGYAAYPNGEKEKAFDCFTRAEEIASDSFDMAWALAWYYEQEAQPEKAAAYYQKCLEFRPASAGGVYPVLADLYGDKLQRPETAEQYYQLALENNPADTASLDKYAAILEKNNRLDEAEALYRKAMEQFPYDSERPNKLGIFYYNRENWPEAAHYFRQAVDINPKDAVLNDNLGLAYENNGQYEEAEIWYLKALECNPNVFTYYNRVGNLYNRTNRFEESIPYYEKAIERNPEYAILHDNLGLSYENLNRLKEAEACYQKAFDLAPTDDQYFRRLSKFYMTNQMIDELVPFWTKAMEIKEEYRQEITDLIAYIQEQEGQTPPETPQA